MKSKIDKINYFKTRYTSSLQIENLIEIYDRYSLWDKKVKVIDNNFCPELKDMNDMIDGVYEFSFNLRDNSDKKEIDLFDIYFVRVNLYNFYLKDVEFTKG